MKLNWKIALMCVLAIAMVACKSKDEPESGSQGGGQSDYKSPISVRDQSVADWDALDQSKVKKAVCPELPYFAGLKEAKVYADAVCINFMLTFDPETMQSHTDVDGIHVYINTDNSDATGGYWDLFAPINGGNIDILLEGALWDADGNELSYAPSVERWNGPLNGEGWYWEPIPASTGVTASQLVGDNIVECRILKELVPAKWDKDAFEIGFDIYQNFEPVGLLPQSNRPDGEHIGRALKMYVEFDK